MPKGAKKRKAAQKKKEKEASNNNNSETHSHDDDLKVHDEKESDGGEVNSPASQDRHNDQHPFTDGEEEERENREDASSVQSITTEHEQMVGVNRNGDITQNVVMEVDNTTEIDRELKPEDDSESKNVSVEYVESLKESNGGWKSQDGGSFNSSSSSSSSSTSISSDDESHVVQKKIVVIESGKSKDDAPNLVGESAAVADLEQIADLPEIAQVTDGGSVMNGYTLAVGEPKEQVNDPVTETAAKVYFDTLADLPEVSQVTESDPVVEVYSLVVGKSSEEAPYSVVETVPLVDLENVTEEVVHLKESMPVDSSKCSSVFDRGLNDNGERESLAVSQVEMDTGSQPKEGKVCSVEIENSAVSAVATVSEAQEYGENLLPASGVPGVGTNNDAEHVKDSVVIECSDSQPLVASAPLPVTTPFWKSCCGLFEVVTGSNG